MARVKIHYPDKTIFETQIDITIDHINYGKHVGNERFLSFCHEARIRYLKSINQDEMNFYSCSLIMGDAEISYKGQVFHGDKISIELAARPMGPHSFEFFYRMKNQESKIVCLAKTGMVYYDYTGLKVTLAPEEWLGRLT